MNKHFAALILGLLLTSVAVSQTSTVLIRDGDDFRGPVHSVRTEVVLVSKYNGEYIEGQRLLSQVKTYSSDGRQCETLFYKQDGNQYKKDIFIYNEMGKWSEWDSYDANGLLVSRKINSFDEEGRITVEVTLNGDGTLQQRKVLVWSSTKNRILEIDTYNGEGEQIRKDVSQYDYRNKKLTWLSEEPGSRRSKQTFDLSNDDPRTRLQEYVGYSANGSVASTHTFADNQAAQHIEKADYDANGSVISKMTENREYDSHKNIIKITQMRLNKEAGTSEPISIIYNTISYY
jgi:hypothetical protein